MPTSPRWLAGDVGDSSCRAGIDPPVPGPLPATRVTVARFASLARRRSLARSFPPAASAATTGPAQGPPQPASAGRVAPVILALIGALWVGGVALLALVANALRYRQGETVLVLDDSRGWGLHRMDVTLVGVALLPLLVVALACVVRRLLPPH